MVRATRRMRCSARADSYRPSIARSSSASSAASRAGRLRGSAPGPGARSACRRGRAAFARGDDARAHAFAGFAGKVAGANFGRCQPRHFHLQVDAVEQRPGNARAVAADRLDAATAAPGRIAGPAAGTGIHRRYQLERAGIRTAAPRAKSSRARIPAARAGPRARCATTPAIRRGTARRGARAKSRPGAAPSRRRRARPRSRCGAGCGTDAIPSGARPRRDRRPKRWPRPAGVRPRPVAAARRAGARPAGSCRSRADRPATGGARRRRRSPARAARAPGRRRRRGRAPAAAATIRLRPAAVPPARTAPRTCSRVRALRTSLFAASAASPPLANGTTIRLPSRAAASAAGKLPSIARTSPVRPSSPRNSQSRSASSGTWPLAASTPSAIGRS